ncbi:YegP family protein [Nonomuraea sp. CA-141351]|uniref:YegP family protein n=1 Tax=Nonomuraea sp. CA-141351 TaxID=3239996 RepID=UPI003D91EB52
MAGRFIISEDGQGGFRFALVANNGQTLAVGEGYPTKIACVNGIETVRRNAPEAVIEDQTGASLGDQGL